jgi:hypothetical protein
MLRRVPTVGDVRRAWREGFRTAKGLRDRVGWDYPLELLDAFLISPFQRLYPDSESLLAAAYDAHSRALRVLLGPAFG